METIFLPQEQWPLIEPIVRAEFNDAMPAVPEQAVFLAGMEGDKIAGFIHVEHLFQFNSVYVAPEYRGQGLGRKLVAEAVARIPGGFSAVWLRPVSQSGDRTAEHFGGRNLGVYIVYRKDC